MYSLTYYYGCVPLIFLGITILVWDLCCESQKISFGTELHGFEDCKIYDLKDLGSDWHLQDTNAIKWG